MSSSCNTMNLIALGVALASHGLATIASTADFEVEVVETVPDLFRSWTAIAIDSQGRPHVAYTSFESDGTGSDVKYGVRTFPGWQLEFLGDDTSTGTSRVSLALDAEDDPHIAYVGIYAPINHGVIHAERPTGAWNLEWVDSRPFGGYSFDLAGIEIDENGKLHVLSDQANRPHSLWYSSKVPGGSWTVELELDSNGAAAIALGSDEKPRFLYAQYPGPEYFTYPDPDTPGSWFTQSIGYSALDANVRLAMDGTSIAYGLGYEQGSDDLLFARRMGTWSVDVVTNVGQVETGGGKSEIAVDGGGVVHIAFYDGAQQDLRYGRWDGSSWELQTVASAGDVGNYCSIAVDPWDQPHISFWDETSKSIGYAGVHDCDHDGVSDADEIAAGTAFDCNGNGIPDECDVLTGAAEDCNGNGLADSCETDCNANGVPDDCDIAGGTSQDCNGDGVPDECEPDCDGDGVPDACDTFEDCNMNGVPDECDIADGTSYDCNINGIPDECDGLPDCNENGVPDRCDILDGTSDDCDFDDVPDECQASYADCNGNGIFDRCDIEDGTSLDCNVNLTPDECDLVDGYTDCDLDGVIDVCNLVLKLELGGASAGNYFGSAIASGDMNGDGLPDLMVGAPGFGARLVYVYLGGEPMDDVPDLELSGTGATFGTAIAVGDFNADTYDDVAVGAPHSGSGAKRVYVFLGSSVPDASADVVISAGTSGANNEFGAALAAVNVNGDANMDLAVGVPANGNAHVRIYLGDDLTSTWATLTGAGTSDEFGASVGNAGDVDGDGLEDVVVGEFESDVPGFPAAGRAHLFLSQPGGTPVPGPEYLGEAAGSRFGYTVSGAGDVNDDGFADVVVGAPYHATSVRGAAFLYLGDVVPDATVDLMIEGIDWFDPIGGTVGPAGDVNGDGIDDFLVGVGLGGFGDGLAHLYFGGDDLDAESERVFFAPLSYDGVGSVGPLGDIDGDGYPEFVVGGPEHDVQRGRVMIFDIDIPDFGDCNDNGEPDACDISGGASFDVNEDGIPDECQALSTETGSSTSLRTRLIGASPAPFNPAAHIEYELADAVGVVLHVFDVSGRRVARVDAGHRAPGRHTLIWSGRGDDGRALPSGTYFLSLELGRDRFRTRLVLLR